jgi:hypothetical protein
MPIGGSPWLRELQEHGKNPARGSRSDHDASTLEEVGVVIFGFGKARTNDLGPAYPTTCPHYINLVSMHYVKRRKWFSLFFVPVVPYTASHRLECPVCSRGSELTSEQAKAAKELCASHAALVSGAITTDEYDNRARTFWFGREVPRPITPPRDWR